MMNNPINKNKHKFWAFWNWKRWKKKIKTLKFLPPCLMSIHTRITLTQQIHKVKKYTSVSNKPSLFECSINSTVIYSLTGYLKYKWRPVLLSAAGNYLPQEKLKIHYPKMFVELKIKGFNRDCWKLELVF
jgi:hypothetical protein